MARLTKIRLEKARDILDRHAEMLRRFGTIDAEALEVELRDRWGVHYQGLKGIMLDLAKTDEYRLVAVRYMESGCPGVVCEFQPTLAKLYGIPYFHSPDRKAMRERFWEEALAVG